jgi:hypothetical protein
MRMQKFSWMAGHVKRLRSFSRRQALRMLASPRTARRLLRVLGFIDPSVTRRTDRAMRTFAARGIAESVHLATRRMFSLPMRFDRQSTIFVALSTRPGWSREGPAVFAHVFGSRRSVISIPAVVDQPTLAALMTRAEINAQLGDTEWQLLASFQDLAARELQRLAARDALRTTR